MSSPVYDQPILLRKRPNQPVPFWLGFWLHLSSVLPISLCPSLVAGHWTPALIKTCLLTAVLMFYCSMWLRSRWFVWSSFLFSTSVGQPCGTGTSPISFVFFFPEKTSGEFGDFPNFSSYDLPIHQHLHLGFPSGQVHNHQAKIQDRASGGWGWVLRELLLVFIRRPGDLDLEQNNIYLLPLKLNKINRFMTCGVSNKHVDIR